MGKVISSIFGGGAAQVQGPDPELVKAQKDQADRLKKQEADAAKEKKANLAVLAARGGGSSVNLNQTTGRAGVSDKLGGAA